MNPFSAPDAIYISKRPQDMRTGSRELLVELADDAVRVGTRYADQLDDLVHVEQLAARHCLSYPLLPLIMQHLFVLLSITQPHIFVPPSKPLQKRNVAP